MIQLERLADGTVAARGHEHSRAQVRDALSPMLVEQFGEWDAEIFVQRARFERMWWSASYNGFTHDCTLHSPNEATPWCADSVPVIVVVDVPDGVASPSLQIEGASE